MNVGEANRVRACLDCGEPGALSCLRKDDWHRFGLVEREPLQEEM